MSLFSSSCRIANRPGSLLLPMTIGPLIVLPLSFFELQTPLLTSSFRECVATRTAQLKRSGAILGDAQAIAAVAGPRR